MEMAGCQFGLTAKKRSLREIANKITRTHGTESFIWEAHSEKSSIALFYVSFISSN